MLNLSFTRKFWKIFSTTWLWKKVFDQYTTITFQQLGNLEALTQIRLKVYYNNAINVRPRDWDQLKYFLTGMAIKEFIFFECLYFSEYDIQMLFVFWTKFCYIFFVHWFDQVHRTSQPAWKMSLFSFIIITIIVSHVIIRIRISFYIRISTKNNHSIFLKRNSYTNDCLKFLYDAKLITPLLIF